MEIIAAVAAFIVLFALWVIVPRFFIQRRQNAETNVTRLHEDVMTSAPAPQAAD